MPSRDTNVAKQLFLTVTDRTRPDASGKTDPLSLFDAGYLTETLREVGRVGERSEQLGPNAAGMTALVRNVDGYDLVLKSLALRPNDGSIELASALIAASSEPTRRSMRATRRRRARRRSRMRCSKRICPESRSSLSRCSPGAIDPVPVPAGQLYSLSARANRRADNVNEDPGLLVDGKDSAWMLHLLRQQYGDAVARPA